MNDRARPPQPEFACPACRVVLEDDTCPGCQAHYERAASGFLDCSPERFGDWFTHDAASAAQWDTESSVDEELGQRHRVDWLLRHLHARGIAPNTVLCVGCGVGADVQRFREKGVAAWGIDPGSRTVRWAARGCGDVFAHASGTAIPFTDNQFDLIFSDGVVEHVGTLEGGTRLAVDWQQQRQTFARECLRVLRPNGQIAVGCPNRLFPIDIFHDGIQVAGGHIRPHPPWERFLLSPGDVKALFSPHAVEPLSTAGLFNEGRLSPPMRVVAYILGRLPRPVNPYLMTLVTKRDRVAQA